MQYLIEIIFFYTMLIILLSVIIIKARKEKSATKKAWFIYSKYAIIPTIKLIAIFLLFPAFLIHGEYYKIAKEWPILSVFITMLPVILCLLLLIFTYIYNKSEPFQLTENEIIVKRWFLVIRRFKIPYKIISEIHICDDLSHSFFNLKRVDIVLSEKSAIKEISCIVGIFNLEIITNDPIRYKANNYYTIEGLTHEEATNIKNELETRIS